jgi:hypothetical protein
VSLEVLEKSRMWKTTLTCNTYYEAVEGVDNQPELGQVKIGMLQDTVVVGGNVI